MDKTPVLYYTYIDSNIYFQIPDGLVYSNVPSQIPLPIDAAQPTMPPPAIVKPILKKDSVYKVSHLTLNHVAMHLLHHTYKSLHCHDRIIFIYTLSIRRIPIVMNITGIAEWRSKA